MVRGCWGVVTNWDWGPLTSESGRAPCEIRAPERRDGTSAPDAPAAQKGVYVGRHGVDSTFLRALSWDDFKWRLATHASFGKSLHGAVILASGYHRTSHNCRAEGNQRPGGAPTPDRKR